VIDHIGIAVSDYEASKAFYVKVLAPMGYKLLMEVQGFAGFGLETAGPVASFWIHEDKTKLAPGMHIAFSAESREQVDQFYQAAMDTDARDNGKPGIREIYHPNYYGAFVFDPDGYNIEAVCHQLA
jgi:catechol 2,3-dioxygenase-like lactoylglutathione lyase family enzyme